MSFLERIIFEIGWALCTKPRVVGHKLMNCAIRMQWKREQRKRLKA